MEKAPADVFTLVVRGTRSDAGTCKGATLRMMGGVSGAGVVVPAGDVGTVEAGAVPENPPAPVASPTRGGGMGGATAGGRGGVTPGLTGVPSYVGVMIPIP